MKIENMKLVAAVQFLTGKQEKLYYFKTDIENLKKGDTLIVKTQYGDTDALFIKYVEPTHFEPGHPTKPVVKKI